MLGKCIEGCEDSTEKKILQIGLEPWNKICSNLKSMNGNFRQTTAKLAKKVSLLKIDFLGKAIFFD
jgi:hypothetical protein